MRSSERVWMCGCVGVWEKRPSHAHTPTPPHPRDSGLVLVIVLWVLVVLVILAWGLAATVQTEARLVSNYSESTRCLEYARSGVATALKKLSETDLSTVTASSPPLHLTSDDEGLKFQGGGRFNANIEDEAGKMNLNSATVEMLTALTGDPDLAASIVAWRGDDKVRSGAAAEDAFYMGLPEPYHCKKAPFETVEEVALVKGMTRERLTEASPGRLPLARLLTVYSIDENVDRHGRMRLNLNTAGESELRDRLSDVLTAKEISAIVSFRSGSQSRQGAPTPTGPAAPFNPGGPSSRPDASAASGRRFQSVADLLDVPGLTREKVMQIADRVTMNDDKTIPGRVNLNTAGAAVLASLPGMNESIAEDIIEYRTGEHRSFADAGEILKVQSITNDVYRRIAEWLTVRNASFRVISTGRIKNSRTRRTVECVVSLLRPDLKATQSAKPDQSKGSQPSQSRPVELKYWRQGV